MSLRTCFVVSPIGQPDSPERKRSDGFLREVIRPVLTACGYQTERGDEDKSPGIVTESVVNKLIDADLVIADLHGHNPNVMYEVALRHATNKPLIQMICRGEPLPFDIGGLNTIFYGETVHDLATWREELGIAVRAAASGALGSNPVARAWLLRRLEAQPTETGAALSEVLSQVSLLRHEIRALSRQTENDLHKTTRRAPLLPEDYVRIVLTEFLQTASSLRGWPFRVDTASRTIIVTGSRNSGDGIAPARRYTFQCEPDAWLSHEVGRLRTALVQDFGTSTADQVLPTEA